MFRFLLPLLIPILFSIEPISIINHYQGLTPNYWGENAPGVMQRIQTRDKVIALTLDACGGKTDRYDKVLIDTLLEYKVPATLFINARWVDKFPDELLQLAASPLFEIENHGLLHRPCSVNGKSAYGIKGTKSIAEVIDEIEGNNNKLFSLTGRRPLFYRSGTAFYDEIAVKIAQDLGCQVAGFSILGDAGATYSAQQVEKAVLSAKPGDIIICHMNHPESGTAAGLNSAIPQLLQQGYRFVLLKDYLSVELPK
jgi:peptidoglycan/xylan/chitin deacetylase (PgdA/CDA1 family)